MRGLLIIAVWGAICGTLRALKLTRTEKDVIPLACQLAMPKYDTDRQCLRTDSQRILDSRLVAIGDIHGSYTGLLEDLYYANITSGRHECNWKPQSVHTVLVQMGDMVDRGPGALESLICLRNLQNQAAVNNAKVVRLLGSKFIPFGNDIQCLTKGDML
jgi:hypothetical protein